MTQEAHCIKTDSDIAHERMYHMETMNNTQFDNGDSRSLNCVANPRVPLEPNHAPRSMSRLERQEVQFRKQQVADSWSKQERAQRIRVGLARRAWLFDSIDAVTNQ